MNMSLSLYPNVVNKNLFVSDAAPSYAVPGDQWFNTKTGLLLMFIRDDAGVGYWVETGASITGGA
jgi:hypothetical protein